MPIEAPLSKFKKNNLKIYAAACILFAVIFAYDGYLSKYTWSHRRSFYEEHVIDGKADDTMKINRIIPFFLFLLAAGFGTRFWKIKDGKIIAEENELIINDKEKIAYDCIQKIDKSNFKSKGYFIITHNSEQGAEQDCKLSDKNYDNLSAVLDHLIERIS